MSPSSISGNSRCVSVGPSPANLSPMCTISRTPLSRAARLARWNISRPMVGTAGPTARSLMPCTSGLLAWTTRTVSSRSMSCRARNLRLVIQAGARDVHHAEDARAGAWYDVAGKAAEGVAARAAGVDQRGHAGEHAGEVGVHRGLVHALVHVGVQVDQPRRHQLARHVDNAGGAVRGDVRRDLRDEAAADRHVEPCARPTRGVDYIAALQNQISHVRGSFRRGLRHRALGAMVYHARSPAQHGDGLPRPGETGDNRLATLPPCRGAYFGLLRATNTGVPAPRFHGDRVRGKAKSVHFCDILCVS